MHDELREFALRRVRLWTGLLLVLGAFIGALLGAMAMLDPTWSLTEMVRGGYPAPDPDKRALAFVNGLSQDDFGDAAATISTTDGTIIPPAAD